MATAEVIAQAKEKIAREVNEYEDLKRESGVAVIMATDERNPFKEYLFQRIDTVDGFAEKVLQDCKSITKGLAWSASKIPEKVKKLKMVHLSTEDVFNMICEYFDWDEAKEAEERKKKAEKAKAQSAVDTAKLQKEREEAEARRKAEEAERLAKKQAEEERKKREKLGICEGQLDIFGLCGMTEPAPAVEEQPEEEPKAPVSIIRPVEHSSLDSSEPLVAPIEEDIVVDIDDDPKLPFSLEFNPLDEVKDPEPSIEATDPEPIEEADVPEPQSEEAVQEDVAEKDIYDLLGF